VLRTLPRKGRKIENKILKKVEAGLSAQARERGVSPIMTEEHLFLGKRINRTSIGAKDILGRRRGYLDRGRGRFETRKGEK